MPYTEAQLVQFVAAKIDEILPPGENVVGDSIIEAPVAFIQRELREAVFDVLRQAPLVQVRQVIKKGTKHFPETPGTSTGLVSVGSPVIVSNNITGILDVEYNIDGIGFSGNPLPVTAGANPTAGLNRRDIIVGNNLGQLEYILGTPNTDADIIDFPNTPAGTVLVMKVIVLDNGSGFDKTYIGGPLTAEAENPNIRVIPSNTPLAYVIPCPTDFLRFVNIRLNSWSKPVTELIPEENDAEYSAQKNISWTRGTELKPKAALISFADYTDEEISATIPNVGLAIECFTSKATPTTIGQFYYVPRLAPDKLPEDLVDPVVWQCAGRVMTILNQTDRAGTAFAMSQRYFTNKYGLKGE